MSDSTGGPQEKRLLGSLLSDYNTLNRPVLNESEALMLTFGITLQQIIDVVSTGKKNTEKSRVGNSLFGFFSESLVLCEQTSNSLFSKS